MKQRLSKPSCAKKLAFFILLIMGCHRGRKNTLIKNLPETLAWAPAPVVKNPIIAKKYHFAAFNNGDINRE